jgi:PadR family transcriptional regulator PadR
MPKSDIAQLLLQWEDVYKKGLLSFWMLLLIQQRPMYAFEMKSAIAEFSQGTIGADEKSIYRALKRFEEAGLIDSDTQPSDVGPPRRYFSLTPSGKELLTQFILRNIGVFQHPTVVKAIEQATAS